MASKSIVNYALGVLLILMGLLIPSFLLLQWLGASSGGDTEKLIMGATLFRVGLVILGLFIIIAGKIYLKGSEIQREKPISGNDSKFVPIILAIILVSAFALRLYKLNYGIWFDEILTYVKYMNMSLGKIITTYDDHNNHLLYTLLARSSLMLFGGSTWSLRFPAVLFGVGSIWALYLLGRQVTTARESLLSATLLSFSYHHIWFSQNARGYIGLLFWTILSSWLFLRACREGQPKLWIMYAIAIALGMYTQMTMFFVVVGHFCIYIYTFITRYKEIRHGKWTGFFLGFFLAGLLTLQLYAFVLPQIFGGMLWQGAETTVPLWKTPVWTLHELVRGMKISFGSSVVAISALLVFSVGSLSFLRKNPMVIYLLVVPAIVGAIIMVGMNYTLWPRLFFFTIGFGVLVIIRGTMFLGKAAVRILNLASTKVVPIGTALCIVLILVSTLSIPAAYAPKQDYLGALDFVEARKEQGDAVVTIGLATFVYRNFYKLDWDEIETMEALNTIRSHASRTWLLYTFPAHMQSVYPEILTSIQNDFKVVERFYGTLGNGTIFVCQSP